MRGMKNNNENVFFESEEEKAKTVDSDKKSKDEPWMENITRYTILNRPQIELLEFEFIKRRLKISKANVKMVSKELQIPYKRAMNYFKIQMLKTDNELKKRTEEGIKELTRINNRIERVWENYQRFSKNIDSKIQQLMDSNKRN